MQEQQGARGLQALCSSSLCVFPTLVPTTLRSTFQQSKGQDTEECVHMASLDMT